MKSSLQSAINLRSEVPSIPRFLMPETRSGGAHDFFAVESDLKLKKQKNEVCHGSCKKKTWYKQHIKQKLTEFVDVYTLEKRVASMMLIYNLI